MNGLQDRQKEYVILLGHELERLTTGLREAGAEAFAHGVTQANLHSAPNINYVKRAALNPNRGEWRPRPLTETEEQQAAEHRRQEAEQAERDRVFFGGEPGGKAH